MIKDTEHYYGLITRLFHWGMAAGFAFMYYTAVAWTINEDNYTLMPYHKAVGFILLVAATLRILWMLVNFTNRPHGNILVKLGHLALYALTLAVPLTGLFKHYGAARAPLDVFGIVVLDKAPAKIEWMSQAGNPHLPLGWLLLVLIVGHIVMAIYHQLKGEKILNRMAGPVR